MKLYLTYYRLHVLYSFLFTEIQAVVEIHVIKMKMMIIPYY